MKTSPSKKSTTPSKAKAASVKASTPIKKSKNAEEDDLKVSLPEEKTLKAAKKTAVKKPSPKGKKQDEDDDDDDLEDEVENIDDFGDEDIDVELNDDDAYKVDKDFEEFDLPKSKNKNIAPPKVKTPKSKGKFNDNEDDFDDLGLETFGDNADYGDDDDDY